MATTADRTSSTEGEFTIDTREHGHPDGPGHVLVEINPVGRSTHMAILAAGEAGRCSFDFSVEATGIQLKKAYVEGMRAPISDLPAWVEPVKDRVEKELGV